MVRFSRKNSLKAVTNDMCKKDMRFLNSENEKKKNLCSLKATLIEVEGISCGNCIRLVLEHFEHYIGVIDVSINVVFARIRIVYDTNIVSVNHLIFELEHLGYVNPRIVQDGSRFYAQQNNDEKDNDDDRRHHYTFESVNDEHQQQLNSNKTHYHRKCFLHDRLALDDSTLESSAIESGTQVTINIQDVDDSFDNFRSEAILDLVIVTAGLFTQKLAAESTRQLLAHHRNSVIDVLKTISGVYKISVLGEFLRVSYNANILGARQILNCLQKAQCQTRHPQSINIQPPWRNHNERDHMLSSLNEKDETFLQNKELNDAYQNLVIVLGALALSFLIIFAPIMEHQNPSQNERSQNLLAQSNFQRHIFTSLISLLSMLIAGRKYRQEFSNWIRTSWIKRSFAPTFLKTWFWGIFLIAFTIDFVWLILGTLPKLIFSYIPSIGNDTMSALNIVALLKTSTPSYYPSIVLLIFSSFLLGDFLDLTLCHKATYNFINGAKQKQKYLETTTDHCQQGHFIQMNNKMTPQTSSGESSELPTSFTNTYRLVLRRDTLDLVGDEGLTKAFRQLKNMDGDENNNNSEDCCHLWMEQITLGRLDHSKLLNSNSTGLKLNMNSTPSFLKYQVTVDVHDQLLQYGDIIYVLDGQTFPVDGIVLRQMCQWENISKAHTSHNPSQNRSFFSTNNPLLAQSAASSSITILNAGDIVFAGSVNLGEPVAVRIINLSNDATVNQFQILTQQVLHCRDPTRLKLSATGFYKRQKDIRLSILLIVILFCLVFILICVCELLKSFSIVSALDSLKFFLSVCMNGMLSIFGTTLGVSSSLAATTVYRALLARDIHLRHPMSVLQYLAMSNRIVIERNGVLSGGRLRLCAACLIPSAFARAGILKLFTSEFYESVEQQATSENVYNLTKFDGDTPITSAVSMNCRDKTQQSLESINLKHQQKGNIIEDCLTPALLKNLNRSSSSILDKCNENNDPHTPMATQQFKTFESLTLCNEQQQEFSDNQAIFSTDIANPSGKEIASHLAYRGIQEEQNTQKDNYTNTQHQSQVFLPSPMNTKLKQNKQIDQQHVQLLSLLLKDDPFSHANFSCKSISPSTTPTTNPLRKSKSYHYFKSTLKASGDLYVPLLDTPSINDNFNNSPLSIMETKQQQHQYSNYNNKTNNNSFFSIRTTSGDYDISKEKANQTDMIKCFTSVASCSQKSTSNSAALTRTGVTTVPVPCLYKLQLQQTPHASFSGLPALNPVPELTAVMNRERKTRRSPLHTLRTYPLKKHSPMLLSHSFSNDSSVHAQSRSENNNIPNHLVDQLKQQRHIPTPYFSEVYNSNTSKLPWNYLNNFQPFRHNLTPYDQYWGTNDVRAIRNFIHTVVSDANSSSCIKESLYHHHHIKPQIDWIYSSKRIVENVPLNSPIAILQPMPPPHAAIYCNNVKRYHLYEANVKLDLPTYQNLISAFWWMLWSVYSIHSNTIVNALNDYLITQEDVPPPIVPKEFSVGLDGELTFELGTIQIGLSVISTASQLRTPSGNIIQLNCETDKFNHFEKKKNDISDCIIETNFRCRGNSLCRNNNEKMISEIHQHENSNQKKKAQCETNACMDILGPSFNMQNDEIPYKDDVAISIQTLESSKNENYMWFLDTNDDNDCCYNDLRNSSQSSLFRCYSFDEGAAYHPSVSSFDLTRQWYLHRSTSVDLTCSNTVGDTYYSWIKSMRHEEGDDDDDDEYEFLLDSNKRKRFQKDIWHEGAQKKSSRKNKKPCIFRIDDDTDSDTNGFEQERQKLTADFKYNVKGELAMSSQEDWIINDSHPVNSFTQNGFQMDSTMVSIHEKKEHVDALGFFKSINDDDNDTSLHSLTPCNLMETGGINKNLKKNASSSSSTLQKLHSLSSDDDDDSIGHSSYKVNEKCEISEKAKKRRSLTILDVLQIKQALETIECFTYKTPAQILEYFCTSAKQYSDAQCNCKIPCPCKTRHQNSTGLAIGSGSMRLAVAVNTPHFEALQNWCRKFVLRGHFMVCLHANNVCIGCAAFKDLVRPRAANFISLLKKLNSEREIWLCTGEDFFNAQEAAESVGIDIANVVCRATPKDKFELVSRLLQPSNITSNPSIVCAIGSEITDMTGCFAADVGITFLHDTPTMSTTNKALTLHSDVLLCRKNPDARDLEFLFFMASALEKAVCRNLKISMWVPTILWILTTVGLWYSKNRLDLDARIEVIRYTASAVLSFMLLQLSNNYCLQFKL